MKHSRIRTAALFALGIIPLQACETPYHQQSGVQSLVPVTSEAVLTYTIAAHDTDLSATEKAKINTFLAPLQLGHHDHLLVTIPRANTPAQNNTRRQNILKLLAHQNAQIIIQAPDELAKRPPLPQASNTTPFVGKYSTPQTSNIMQKGLFRAVRTTDIRVNCTQPHATCVNEKNIANMIANEQNVFKPKQTQNNQKQRNENINNNNQN